MLKNKKISYISPLGPEAPMDRFAPKFGRAVRVADVITSNKFLVIGHGEWI